MPIGQYIISVKNSGFTHDQAVAFAAAHNGALATLSTPEENNLFLSFLTADALLWHTVGGARLGPWIGLSQTPGSVEPGGGWHWDNGETYISTAWHPSQPDNFAGDSFGIFFDFNGFIGWGDTINDPGTAGFGTVNSVAVELDASRKNLNGTDGHDFIWGGDTENFIRGKGGNDILSGGDGDDTIIGDAGNDTIIGGLGGEQFAGGKGADHFVYQTADDTASLLNLFDVINDFSHKQGDVIDFSALPGDLQFIYSDEFFDVGQVRFERTHEWGGWFLFVNLSGDSAPEIEILMNHKVQLSDLVL